MIMSFIGQEDEGFNDHVSITFNDINDQKNENLLIKRISEIIKVHDIRCKINIDFYKNGLITVTKKKNRQGKTLKSRKQKIITDYPYRTEVINKNP